MTTEETLRKALADLVAGIGECTCHEGYTSRKMEDPECNFHENLPEITAARAALAIPPTEERIEYRAAWDLYLRRTGHLIDPKWDLFNNLIDARLMLGQVADESNRSSLVEARNLRVEERAAAGEWKVKL